jgi:hypothetical protein
MDISSSERNKKQVYGISKPPARSDHRNASLTQSEPASHPGVDLEQEFQVSRVTPSNGFRPARPR